MISIYSGTLLSIFLISLASHTVGSDILVVCPTASYSHQQPFLLISQALLERQHSVTLLTCNPEKMKAHENLTLVDLSFGYSFVQSNKVVQMRHTQWSNIRSFSGLMTSEVSSLYWTHPNIQSFLQNIITTNKTFDLMILETWMHQSYLGLVDIIGDPPIIQMATAHSFSFLTLPYNNPENPAYVPVIWTANTDTMTFWQRLTNTIAYSMYYFYYLQAIQDEDKVRHAHLDKKYIKRSLLEIFLDNPRSSFMTSTDSRITGYSRPVQPKIVEVGPLHLREPKPLDQDLHNWLQAAEKGVIYFSLGSNMRSTSMGEARRRAFLNAFSRFPQYRVLWKWEGEERMEGQSDNVLLRKWMAQQDVLAHPKVKLFITHGGLQSMQEAFHYGVKLICMPMFGDQDLNCQRVGKIKTGVVLEFNDLSEEIIYNALKTILEDPTYEQNMQYYSLLSKDTPMSPKQKSVWWIEYVLRHKGVQHLHSGAADLSYVQYYLLDVIAFVLALLTALVTSLYLLFRKILRVIYKRSHSTKPLKKKKIN